jgi:hypothetical protein
LKKERVHWSFPQRIDAPVNRGIDELKVFYGQMKTP